MISPLETISSVSFNELVSQLRYRVDLGYINEKEMGELSLFNYTPECTFGKKWDPYTLSSRGLIVDNNKKIVVATPFPKFFNYGESFEHDVPAPDLPDLPFEVMTKYDGSLGIAYHHNGQWRVSTRGSFESDQALWATDWLNRNLPRNLCKDTTYLFEVIYPDNRIVIKYDFEGLVLLGAYKNFKEVHVNDIADIFSGNKGFRIAEFHNYDSIDDLLSLAKILPASDEGFVVKFNNGYRIKIKGDEYCRVHRIISNINPLPIWDMLRNGDNTDFIKMQIPEEFHVDFDKIVNILSNDFNDANKLVDFYFKRVSSSVDINNRKEFALKVNELVKYSPYKSCMFAKLDGKNYDDIIWKNLRPLNNKLDGYSQSSVMNRFGDSENN